MQTWHFLGVALLALAVGCAKGSDGTTGAPADGGAGTSGNDAGGGASGSAGAAASAGAAGAAGSAGAADGGGECLAAADCKSALGQCVTVDCVSGTCKYTNVPAGPSPEQVAGDCHHAECDGAGHLHNAVDDSDVPVDGKSCTSDVCTLGARSNPPLASGTSCGTNLTCDGAGNCAGCTTAPDCPGADTDCASRSCNAGSCGTSYATAGTATSTQTTGDCQVNVCDGSGGVTFQIDDTDVPVDGDPCTNDVCTNGVPSNPANGTCGGCTTAADCPGTDTDCSFRTCSSGACGTTTLGAGDPAANQVAGDCKSRVCDGSGGVITVTDNADVPVDGNQCTTDVCTNGVASNPDAASGTACTQGGGKLCDGNGACVQCLAGSDCTSGVCQAGKCGSGACGAGTVDCDGQSGNGCECSGNICCGAQCEPQHVNGLGQTFDDCSPSAVPGNAATYTVTLAQEARAAWPDSGTDVQAKCVGPNGGEVVYRQTATSCAMWMYTGNLAGHVHLGASCACPTATDPTWY